MVTARIVDYDADKRTYYLPREHAALLTQAAAPNNFAVFAQYISVMGAVEDQVVAAFTHGSGVPLFGIYEVSCSNGGGKWLNDCRSSA